MGPCGSLDPGHVLAQTKTTSRSLALVVLAAGKGKRLKSARPRRCCIPSAAKPTLWHVLQAGLAAKPSKIVVVVGHGADDVRAAVRSWDITPTPVFVEQAEQLGHRPRGPGGPTKVGRVDDVLVANGDYDPVTGADVKALVTAHRRSRAAATIGSTELDDPGGLRAGRARRRAGASRSSKTSTRRRRSGASARSRSTGRLPPRRALRRAPEARPQEPTARVLPEPGDPDAHWPTARRCRPCRSTPAARWV